MSRTEVYVDPNGGNDTTGDGTSDGTAWATVQHALDNTTLGTDGTRINIKANGTDTLSAALDMTSGFTGTPSISAPLTFQGYATVAGDGDFEAGTGIGVVQGAGSAASIWSSTTVENVHWVDMELDGNGTSAVIVHSDRYWCMANVELHNGTGAGWTAVNASFNVMFGCHVHNIGGIGVSGASRVEYSYFKNETNDFTTAISTGGNAIGNIVSVDGATNGILISGGSGICANNTVLSSSGTGVGIDLQNTTLGTTNINNYVEGYDGAGGVGMRSDSVYHRYVQGNNAFRSNTTDTDYDPDSQGGVALDLTANDVLAMGATGLAKSGADTFANRLTYFAPIATLEDDGYPTVS